MSINWQAVGAVGTALGALATVIFAILAIWGEMIKSYLYGPKLKLELHKDTGEFAPFFQLDPRTGEKINKTEAFYYHLKVTNDRPRAPARNCRILLKEIYREKPDGQFSPAEFSVPRQFIWAPGGFAAASQTITKEHVFDFGISPRNKGFTPRLYDPPGNFRGIVGENEAVIYGVQIVAENFVSKNNYYYKVTWNGKWSQDPGDMATYLIITQVEKPEK